MPLASACSRLLSLACIWPCWTESDTLTGQLPSAVQSQSRATPQTARLLVYAGGQLRRHADGAVPRHGNRPKTRRRIQLRLLQGLPGIGPSRAAALLEQFERVEAVMSASIESMQMVDGIGSKTAASIRWALE